MQTCTPLQHTPTSPGLGARVALSIALGFAGNAFAQNDAQTTGLPLWEAGVFAGGISSPAYPASNERNQRALVLPFFVYRGEVLRADRSGIGARMVNTDRFELDIGFAASLPASSDDVVLRRGMPDLGTLIEFGPRAKIKLAEPAPGQRVSLEVPLRAVLEFSGGARQVGYALEPRLAYEWSQVGSWRLRSSLSLVVGDQQLNQYFYGVDAAYATATRPAYQAQAGLISSRLGLDGSTRLSPDVNLFAFVRHDLHEGTANRASPLFAQNQGTSVGLGLTWTLGRSETRVASSAR